MSNDDIWDIGGDREGTNGFRVIEDEDLLWDEWGFRGEKDWASISWGIGDGIRSDDNLDIDMVRIG
jgi:hypothetical protein